MNPIVILVSGGIKQKIVALILMNAKKIFIHAQKQKHASIRSSHSNATQFWNVKKALLLIVLAAVALVSMIELSLDGALDNK